MLRTFIFFLSFAGLCFSEDPPEKKPAKQPSIVEDYTKFVENPEKGLTIQSKSGLKLTIPSVKIELKYNTALMPHRMRTEYKGSAQFNGIKRSFLVLDVKENSLYLGQDKVTHTKLMTELKANSKKVKPLLCIVVSANTTSLPIAEIAFAVENGHTLLFLFGQ